MIVRPTDLPTGWTATAYQDGGGNHAAQASLVKCIGGKDTSADKFNETHSDDYALNDQATISSQAERFKSQDDVAADTALLASPKASACYIAETKASLGTVASGTKVDGISIKITPGSAGGPKNVVATGAGTISITVSGQTVKAYLNVAFIAGPKIEAEVDFNGFGTPTDTALRTSVIKAVADRVARG
jgi:hypothetical protein